MRKIEEQMLRAIRRALDTDRNWASGNTAVVRSSTEVNEYPRADVYLHGNLIARLEQLPDGLVVQLADGGWRSATTKSRLNAIAREFGVAGVYQHDFTWYFEGGSPFECWRVQIGR